MGAALSKISEACLAAGATPIFAHEEERGRARMDAKALKEQENRQRVLNALTQHGGMAGISVPRLKQYLPFSKETAKQRLRECQIARRSIKTEGFLAFLGQTCGLDAEVGVTAAG